eukprot:CAMPEP_0172837410 /NCGR_PEP_ID=MMETSP1075-20121228/27171_1 /TAXON_ID=2916 /ORGANISM="Ceratium fusus, Strain PA161109" /LENGTH=244 /DNA_ID=CAMNT_0013680787 /DNA_START=61 /DNA_END=795 /DNA_ORIENTATION=-
MKEDFAVRGISYSWPMWFTKPPEAHILLPIKPCQNAKPMLAVVLVLAAISATVRPDAFATAVEQGITPNTMDLAAVRVDVMTVSVYAVCPPLTRVRGAVMPFVNAITLLFASIKVASITAVRLTTAIALLHSAAMLPVFSPLTVVGGICHQVTLVVVDTHAVRTIAAPLSDEHVTVFVNELAEALNFVVMPAPNVPCTSGESLLAFAMPGIAPPLASIAATCPAKGKRWPRTIGAVGGHLLKLQ